MGGTRNLITNMEESTRNEDILKAVNYQLVVFADSLKPSKEFKTVANDVFQKVMESIKRDRTFSVNRSVKAGSYGKNTSVLFPDIDAVVFLNNKQHPLTDEIDAIVDLLKIKAKELGIIPHSITKSSKTVKLEFYNGLEMDLLPACQFSQGMYEQYRQVLDRIKLYPENFYMYSSSLAVIQSQFLKDQPGSTHQLITLLKYWFKSLTLDAEIHGGSYLIEIICVVVCNETKKQSLIKNLRAAFQKITNIEKLRVAFLLKNIDNKLCWTLLQTNEEFEKHKNEFSPLISQRSNFIIDPSNPFNDLFNPKNLTDKVVTQLKECAEEMVRRVELLDSIESNELKTVITASNTDPDVKLRIDKLFEPHAMTLCKKYEELPEEIVFHVDFPANFKCQNMSKLIDPKSPKFFVENKVAKKVSKTVRNNLLFLLRGKARVDVSTRENGAKGVREVKKYVFADGIPDVVNLDDVKDAVRTFIQQNNFKVRNSSATRDHEKCDVTLYVPYTCNDTNLALRFSMKWKEKLEKKNTVFCGKNWRTRVALLSLSIGAITATLMIILGR